MKNLILNKTTHPQSGKEVNGILICEKQFIYSDVRGYQRKAIIPKEFANQIISSFPVKKGFTGKPCYYPERMTEETALLSWDLYADNRIGLKIHVNNGHVWSSEVIETNI